MEDGRFTALYATLTVPVGVFREARFSAAS
jgi:hypothetical protein